MKMDKETLFGIIIMIIGSYILAMGLTQGKLNFSVVGFVFYGFAILLWIEGIGRCLRDDIIDALCDEEEEEETTDDAS
jgi:hypothetical protein